MKKRFPALETRQSHAIEYMVSKTIPEDTERAIKVYGTARFISTYDTDVQLKHHV